AGNGVVFAPTIRKSCSPISASTASTPSMLVPEIMPTKRSLMVLGRSERDSRPEPTGAEARSVRCHRRSAVGVELELAPERGRCRPEVFLNLGWHRIRRWQRYGPRISVHPVDAVLVVQVRTRREPRLTDVADDFALGHAPTDADVRESRHVTV